MSGENDSPFNAIFAIILIFAPPVWWFSHTPNQYGIQKESEEIFERIAPWGSWYSPRSITTHQDVWVIRRRSAGRMTEEIIPTEKILSVSISGGFFYDKLLIDLGPFRTKSFFFMRDGTAQIITETWIRKVSSHEHGSLWQGGEAVRYRQMRIEQLTNKQNRSEKQ